jgi:hypothetical protein
MSRETRTKLEWVVAIETKIGGYKFYMPPVLVTQVPIGKAAIVMFNGACKYEIHSRHGRNFEEAHKIEEALNAAREIHRL